MVGTLLVQKQQGFFPYENMSTLGIQHRLATRSFGPNPGMEYPAHDTLKAEHGCSASLAFKNPLR